MTTQRLFDESLADEAGTGWKVTFGAQYRPWLAAADSNDPRPALTGIYIDPAGWLVASDGFVLAVIPAQIQPGILQTEQFEGALVPAQFVKSAYKAARSRKLESVDLTIVGDRARYEVPGGGTWCDLIEEPYANWRGLLPDRVEPAKNTAVNPDLAARLSEALGGALFQFQSGPGENSPFLMAGSDGESLGMVMGVLVLRDPPTSLLTRALTVAGLPLKAPI